MGNGTTTIVVVQNVPVAHANKITSGSTTSHHLIEGSSLIFTFNNIFLIKKSLR
jgi:hypothetical protein